MITNLRLKFIQLWILFQYGFIESYQVMIEDAYGINEAIDLLESHRSWCVDEYIDVSAAAFYEDEDNIQHLADLSEATWHLEHALDYMRNPNKYVSTYWNQHYMKYREDFDQMNDHSL